jgi:hypothetical protein
MMPEPTESSQQPDSDEIQQDFDVYFDVWAPPDEPLAAAALESIAEGVAVKISNGRERFFVSVVEVDAPLIVGRVDNVLVRPAPYAYGDLVAFSVTDVWHVRSAAERDLLTNTIRAMLQEQIASGVPAAEAVRRLMHSTASGE